MAAETAVADARATMLTLAIGTTLVGIMLAISFSYSMSKPIFEHAGRRTRGGRQFHRPDRQSTADELGRLLRSLDAMQSHLKARADDAASSLIIMDVVSSARA